MEEEIEFTKLLVKVERPPISIFEMVEGKQDIDRTHYYEHGWADNNHLFWMVPDGVYLCTQADHPCVAEVKGGSVKWKPVTAAPIGNTIEELTKPKDVEIKAPTAKVSAGSSIADIMHTTTKEEKKHK